MAKVVKQAATPSIPDSLITEWQNAVAQCAEWTLREKTLREQIFAKAFPNPVEGKNALRIQHNMALVGAYRINRKVDKALVAENLENENMRPLLEQVFTWEPKLNEKEYKALDLEDLRAIAPMITETPGLPGLEVKPQSKVRW